MILRLLTDWLLKEEGRRRKEKVSRRTSLTPGFSLGIPEVSLSRDRDRIKQK